MKASKLLIVVVIGYLSPVNASANEANHRQNSNHQQYSEYSQAANNPHYTANNPDTSIAPQTSIHPSCLSVEARLTTYLQGGYDLGVYYNAKNSRFSFGLLGASHDISGSTKNLLFTSSDHDRLDIRLSWIISAVTRYHFAKHGEGFFAELGLGAEQFGVETGGMEFSDVNAFVSPAIGYTWYPWKRSGFYILPKINANMILFRPDEQSGNEGTSFRLRPFFATPSIAIGWKFDLK